MFEQSWVDKLAPYVNAWAEAALDVHDLGEPFQEGNYRAYLRWFHGATRVRCFPVPLQAAPHDAEITDTFAMEPPAAFHSLVRVFVEYHFYYNYFENDYSQCLKKFMSGLQTDICNEVGHELLSYAQRYEQHPPQVTRIELVAALRRLGQRCLAGVRRASCRDTTDAVVHGDQGMPPPPPVGSVGRSRPTQQETPRVLGTSRLSFLLRTDHAIVNETV